VHGDLHDGCADTAGGAADEQRLAGPDVELSRMRCAVSAGTGMPAASAKDKPSGMTAHASRTTCSAYVADPLPKTASPMDSPSTPGPSSSTVPAASIPVPAGRATSIISRMCPARIFQSIALTPAARTAMRTCPGPAWGSSTSSTLRTSGSPYSA